MSKITGILIKTGMHPGVRWQGNDYSPQEKSQNIVLTISIKLYSHISFSAGGGTTKNTKLIMPNFCFARIIQIYLVLFAENTNPFHLMSLTHIPLQLTSPTGPTLRSTCLSPAHGLGTSTDISDTSKMQGC